MTLVPVSPDKISLKLTIFGVKVTLDIVPLPEHLISNELPDTVAISKYELDTKPEVVGVYVT